jgi:ribosomal protein S11
MSEKPVTMRLSASEWAKLAMAIGVQLIAVVVYVQGIDHKAETARATATEARAEVRELRDKTDTKLERIDEKVNKINDGVARIQATLERRVP